MRAMSLRVLREMVRCEPERFHSYAELTILKLLEAHKDDVKEVRVAYVRVSVLCVSVC